MTENTPTPHAEPTSGVGRRGLLTAGALAAAGTLAAAPADARPAHAGGPRRGHSASAAMPLAFGPSRRMRIVQFNDTQGGHRADRRTLEFMGEVLDREKPDFALINGDVIDGSPRTDLEVKQAVNNVVSPMESRGVKWAVTFGNHDEDSVQEHGTSMTEDRILDFVRQYRHNLNPAKIEGVPGHTNAQILVRGSRGAAPAFAIWLLDSGRYATEADTRGQSTEGLMGYDWIRPRQIRWYEETSEATAERFGRPVPGLMFFHIPTFEHSFMWYASQGEKDEARHEEAVRRHAIEGVKHEDVYHGLVNSGIYASVKERGEVKGIYCGHDHINTYKGDYYGVELGYAPGTGFDTYGLNDGTWDQHTLRGARVFELDERNSSVYAGATRVVWARDLGIDMDPQARPLDAPVPFPPYVKP
ncbi:metallophosphoesterase family protein [Micrococcus sp.]|uniref:metallophosphoesterase family protein n=1 Tax=Micrococcus sp. TaxID=1271 RepID=UPI0026DCA9C9|nr:metallophosphoesterase family protein [Micrococcus sp.]MDO4240811.1 metallophosphoesterase family protein [Micrococcus sp.]